MTELGHSSHLRGLETTATYLPESQEFVIHTPSLTGSKWWIGNAGQIATHTVALAHLVVGGKSLGLHYFVVPLRNLETGAPLPGISVGHVGSKAVCDLCKDFLNT